MCKGWLLGHTHFLTATGQCGSRPHWAVGSRRCLPTTGLRREAAGGAAPVGQRLLCFFQGYNHAVKHSVLRRKGQAGANPGAPRQGHRAGRWGTGDRRPLCLPV